MNRFGRITNHVATDRARAIVNSRPTDPGQREWFRLVVDKAAESAELFIYDEIGYWGTTASEFAQQLAALDVKAITLRINSPGGEVFDGVAIYNALKTHKANVSVFVDGLAASAASFIAMAGDTITMQRGAQMMIHDASGMAFGNAATMRQLADLLDKLSDTIAGFYKARAGGTVAGWRESMRVESWYNPDEAVAAGLADIAAADPAPEDSATARHTWDLRDVLGYAYANRAEAPAPKPVPPTDPAEPEPEPLGALDLDAMRAALAPPSLTIAPADMLAAVQFGTNTVPEPDAPTAPPLPPADPWVDVYLPSTSDLRQSVREAHL